MLGASNFSPEIAVPITGKMPEPITAPMPSAVSDHGPRVFFKQRSGSSESRISLSIDLRASSWLGRAVLLGLSMRVFEAASTRFRLGVRPAGTRFMLLPFLPLRLAASQLFHLLLVRAAR